MKVVLTTKKLLAILASVVLVALGAYIFVFLSLRSVAAESAELAAELSYQNDRNKRLGSVETTARNTEEERIALEEHFISQDDIVFFITTIEELGSSIALDVSVVSVTEKPAEGLPQESELEIKIAFSGTWDQVTQMIALLELHSLPSTITDVHVTKTENEEGGVSWSGSATLVSVVVASNEE